MLPMRITVTIDDDVLAVARLMAAQRGSSLGSVLSELARRGSESGSRAPRVEDASAFTVRPDAEPITTEEVHRSLDDWP